MCHEERTARSPTKNPLPMPIPGKSFTAGIAYYAGNPASASLTAFDVPKGTLVLDTTNGVLYQKILGLGTNTSGYDQIVSLTGTQTLTNKTFTGAASASPIITGNAGSGTIFCKQALFTEDATSLTHTATFTVPAGASLLDIIVIPQVLWTGGTAAFTCGDANSANGWFTTANLKATDLVLGERLQASNANNWGGVNGSYLTTAGRFGQQSANMIGGFCPTAYSVIGVVTVGTPATTVGRTRMYVLWSVGESVTPVLA